MNKLMKLVVLMAIMGSIWGCGTEQANVDEATNKNVEHKEMAAETERQDESNEGASKGQDAVISDDAMSSDTNTESKSEDDCLKTGNYYSEIYDVKEQGEQYEIHAKLILNEYLYVTPEEFDTYEVGKSYHFGAVEKEMFCSEKSEEICYFTDSEEISLEDALAWGDVVAYRVDKTNPEVNQLPVLKHFGNVTGDDWVPVKTGETVEVTLMADKDCVIEYYNQNYELSRTTLVEFVNNQTKGSSAFLSLWRNLYYTQLEIGERGEAVKITEEMPAG